MNKPNDTRSSVGYVRKLPEIGDKIIARLDAVLEMYARMDDLRRQADAIELQIEASEGTIHSHIHGTWTRAEIKKAHADAGFPPNKFL